MRKLLHILSDRWHGPGGYKDFLALAIPLIVTTGSFILQAFVDRIFLPRYSSDAIAASVPSGLISFSLTSLFIGLASYVGTFVAQFYGARQFARIGKIVWQGIYTIFPALLLIVPAWIAIPVLIYWTVEKVRLII